ncbi:TRAP transporter small permease [uncultured Ruegeria sp.]|uniref:TRAP transporter small permease n=1 Tax=uncultured Ruegeria sp. TaxID=259304 RepID=UPI00261FC2E2|nr:TRAP transporter small permease [uncultured Ruegeria sp.]
MHRFIERLAHGMALLGGVALSLLILLTCLSVAGRVLNGMLHNWIGSLAPGFAEWALDLGIGPINGDFEIVEAGVAFAIFAFMPLCQLTSGHAVVDIFTSNLSPRVNRVLRMLTEVVFAIVLVVIAVQLFGGMLAKQRFGENTFILQFPVWWGYAASFVAAALGAIVGIYMAGLRCREWLVGEDLEA